MILRHCGLWCPTAPRAPPAGDLRIHAPNGDSAASDEARELTFVDEATFWAPSDFPRRASAARTVRDGNGRDPKFAA